MICHMVYCHPSAQSFSMAIRRRVLEATLRDKSRLVTEAMLYEQGFNPVMSLLEYQSYFETSAMDATTALFAKQLREADHIVFVFPVWMYSLPAMLKGYLDRVWRPNVTFCMTAGTIQPFLTRVQSISVLCTFGQTLDQVRTWGDDSVRNLFARLIVQNCDARCKLVYLPFYGCDSASITRLGEYLDYVEESLSSVYDMAV